jgi:DNA helicase-2/ATP-dependent DNA helicase PcrA
VKACKSSLDDGTDPGRLVRLAIRQNVEVAGLESTVFGLVPQILDRCLKMTASIDFDDMVWLPVQLGLAFPRTEVLFVDEAQDLDACQHALVRLMVGEGRMVMVGDPRQAIYAFRGADARSMATLAGHLRGTPRGLVTLPLTMTRRCPRGHVKLVRNIVPDFESLPGSPMGRWEENKDASDIVEPGWMVLCRKNAPLLGMAFRLVARNIPVAIQGREIGEGLGRFVDDFEATTAAGLLRKVADYRSDELARLSELDDVEEEVELVSDRCACVSAAASGCTTAADVSAKIRSLFLEVDGRDQGRYVLLSSIHRAKGREAERVAILEPETMPSPWARSPGAIEQEENLLYVASTRSKHRLSFLGPIPDLLKG